MSRRVIKFRAWDLNLKQMRQVMTLETDNGKSIEYQAQYYAEGSYTYRAGIELMQFTGLKDLDGYEIYEGDVVLADYWSFGTCKRKQFTVEYLAEEVGFNIGGLENVRIIGNVFENPELV